MTRPGRSFLRALTADLVDLEFGPVSADERARTVDWVAERVAGAGDVTRLGLDAGGLVVAAVIRARTGAAYTALGPEDRRRIARALAATSLPPAAEYVRAIRSLAVAYLYELRHASVPS